jgi:malate dehydrogenase
MASSPVHVTVTGAAGQIGYALVHRIASGSLLGPDQPVVLRLLEIEPAMPMLEGVVMELDDGAHPLLAGIEATSDLKTGVRRHVVGVARGLDPARRAWSAATSCR